MFAGPITELVIPHSGEGEEHAVVIGAIIEELCYAILTFVDRIRLEVIYITLKLRSWVRHLVRGFFRVDDLQQTANSQKAARHASSS